MIDWAKRFFTPKKIDTVTNYYEEMAKEAQLFRDKNCLDIHRNPRDRRFHDEYFKELKNENAPCSDYGPSVKIETSCTGCFYHKFEKVTIDGNAGNNGSSFTRWCIKDEKRVIDVNSMSDKTPKWCPYLTNYLDLKVRSFIAK